jgi:hypothetical protein
MRTVWVNSAGRDWDGPGMEPDAVISGLGELEAVLSGWAG